MAIVVAEPPALAVPLAEMKAFLRIGTSDEDALLAGLARAAAETVRGLYRPGADRRGRSRRCCRRRPAWTRLGAAPVRAIDGVAALDADGDASAAAGGRLCDRHRRRRRRLGAACRRRRRVEAGPRISYRAGMATDPNGLPEALRHGIVRLAAHLYSAPRPAPSGAGPPAAVTALWRPWRRLRLGRTDVRGPDRARRARGGTAGARRGARRWPSGSREDAAARRARSRRTRRACGCRARASAAVRARAGAALGDRGADRDERRERGAGRGGDRPRCAAMAGLNGVYDGPPLQAAPPLCDDRGRAGERLEPQERRRAASCGWRSCSATRASGRRGCARLAAAARGGDRRRSGGELDGWRLVTLRLRAQPIAARARRSMDRDAVEYRARMLKA